METMCGVFDKAIDTKKVVDLHDMMFRYTLDSFVL
jgi:hypothetical protein